MSTPFKLNDDQKESIRMHIRFAVNAYEEAWDNLSAIERLTNRTLDSLVDICEAAGAAGGISDQTIEALFEEIEETEENEEE